MDKMEQIAKEAQETPDVLKNAPINTPGKKTG